MLCLRHMRALALNNAFRRATNKYMSTAQHGEEPMKSLSQFQERKMLHEFDNVYDRNKDGFICKEDIHSLRHLLTSYYMMNHGSALEETYLAKYNDYWTLFTELADKNKDGKLSRLEWLEMWAHINDQAQDISFLSLPMWVRLMPASIFSAIDIKRDGIIDFEEYQHFWYYLAKFDTKYTKIKSMFQAMTEDGKYHIDLKRFEELYADFYLSSDTSTPGKHIAGPAEFNINSIYGKNTLD